MATVPAVNAKRRRRIERQLRALYAMQSHMNTRDIVLSLLAIPFLALLCFLVGAKLQVAYGSLLDVDPRRARFRRRRSG